MTLILEKLYTLLNEDLYIRCPILSGNMQNHIKITSIGNNEVTLCIEAPFYDMKEWKKTGKIIHTGKTSKDGITTDYANIVNTKGAFAKGNASMHWVNRSCFTVASAIAQEVGGVVINELEL